MKIAIDVRHLCAPRTSGIGRYTIELIKEMANQAPKIRFLLFAAGSQNTLSHLPDFKASNIFITRKQTPNRIISALLRLPNGPALEDFLPEQPDLWFFPNINIIRTKLPYVITVHDLSFDIYPEFFTRKDRSWYKAAKTKDLIKNAKHILAVSDNTKQDLTSRFQIPDSKITVTHLGADKNYHPKTEPCDKNFLLLNKIKFPYFLSLCALEPRKNIESILEAYEIWRDQKPQRFNDSTTPHLVVAGGYGWKAKHIFKLVEKSKYNNCIHLIGYVEEKHKPALYRNATAFVFPSFYEGFGLPVVEAAACGAKIITSFSGSLPEVAPENAIFIDPYNVSDLVKAFDQITISPIASVSYERIAIRPYILPPEFSWKITAQKTLEQLI